jgi:hypothetical protein
VTTHSLDPTADLRVRHERQPLLLRVQAIWPSPEPIWARVPFDEFHHGVRGLIADRSGCVTSIEKP